MKAFMSVLASLAASRFAAADTVPGAAITLLTGTNVPEMGIVGAAAAVIGGAIFIAIRRKIN